MLNIMPGVDANVYDKFHVPLFGSDRAGSSITRLLLRGMAESIGEAPLTFEKSRDTPRRSTDLVITVCGNGTLLVRSKV